MARILFLTELLPYPLVSGAKIRAYYVLRHLATRHKVTLLSFVRPDDRPEDVAHLAGFLDQVHTVPMQRSWPRNIRAGLSSLVTGRPAIIAREDIRAMRLKVQALLAADPYQVVLFVYLHECFHLLVKRARRNTRQKESMCDRYAARYLVDRFGAVVRDEKGRLVPRDVWEFQDLDDGQKQGLRSSYQVS